MVRRIRICSTCSKRFIALHSTHYDCCRKKSDKNDAADAYQTTNGTPNPLAQPSIEKAVDLDHVSALERNLEICIIPDNVDAESGLRSDEKLGSDYFDESTISPFHATINVDSEKRQPSLHLKSMAMIPSCNSGNVVDLLSEEEDAISEHDDENEPILVDFIEDDTNTEPEFEAISFREPPLKASALLNPDHNECERHQDEQDGSEAVALDLNPINGIASMDHQSICLVCGSSLAALTSSKSRINHIKRCAKKHGVTASDVRYNDDYEQFIEVNDEKNETYSGDQEEASTSSLRKTQQQNNPYSSKRQQWHGDAASTTNAVAVPNVNGILMAGARRAAKVAQIQKMTTLTNIPGPRKRPRFNNAATDALPSARTNGNCPKYKLIPGTDFCCDGFHYAKTSLTTNYFLTHFHSDHYGGISKHWNVGTIYCSLPTANLVHQQLGVDRKYLHPLPLHTPTIIASKGTAVTVTLLNANHCPGAIMFLFEVGKRVILHVGDFRWNYNIMSSQLPLRPYCRKPWSGQENTSIQRIDDLFLDTTYCDVQYDLPTQKECIQAVIKVAEKEIRHPNSSKTSKVLMLFGAYTIGKEAVYMSVAKALGMKVYVDKRRYRILSTLDWSPSDISILTTDPNGTNIWVVPLGHINMKKLASYKSIHMKGFSRDFDRVVGFRPTGWSLSSKTHKSGIIGTTDKGMLTLHTVPYSEHSSFPELVECLETLNPKRIIPTVSVNKSQQQIDLLLSHWRDKQATRFLHN